MDRKEDSTQIESEKEETLQSMCLSENQKRNQTFSIRAAGTANLKKEREPERTTRDDRKLSLKKKQGQDGG